jgi:hypothetical protein
MKWITLTGVLLSLLAGFAIVTGCDSKEPQTTAASGDVIPATLVLKEAPADAKDVKALKSGAVKEGDAVVLRGVVGGRVDPIAANRAIMTVIDPSIQTCDKMEGGDDHCRTPWDACCEDPDSITASSATVQVVNGQGQPLKAGLENVGGIKPLKEVVVVGKVRSADEKSLVVDATGIYVKG